MEEPFKDDDYYLNIIKDTSFLADSTKQKYLRTCAIIKESISVGKTLHYIIRFPDEYFDDLTKYINNTKGIMGKNTLSIHTKEHYMKPILAMFKFNSELKEKLKDIHAEWDKFYKIVRQPIDQLYLSNEPTERQSKAFIPFEEIVAIKNSLSIGSQERLLISMYTDIPPVRSDYYSTKIYSSYPTNPDSDNFIVINDYESLLVLSKYKTSGKYGTIYINLPPSLKDEILYSIKLIPRDYLFVSSRTKNKYNTTCAFNDWANYHLKLIFGKQEFSLTMLRHIYVSREDLALESKSGLEANEIAKLMGHSVDQQRKYMWHSWLKKKEL